MIIKYSKILKKCYNNYEDNSRNINSDNSSQKFKQKNTFPCFISNIILFLLGMTDVNCERSVVLWDIIDKETATKDMYVYSDGRVTNKYWQEGKMFKRFSNGSCK